MSRGQAVALLVGIALVLLAAMWWGWHRRVARTSAGLGSAPATLTASATLAVDGVYVSSTLAGLWLERVAADGLGVRSKVRVEVSPDGVTMLRTGAPDVVIPAAALLGARRERGIAGKVVEPGGLVVVRWRRGDVELDTGVRTRYERDRDPLVDAINALTPALSPHPQEDPT